jgi:hypothetical protein
MNIFQKLKKCLQLAYFNMLKPTQMKDILQHQPIMNEGKALDPLSVSTCPTLITFCKVSSMMLVPKFKQHLAQLQSFLHELGNIIIFDHAPLGISNG